jgi:hypothetical protein
VRADARADEVVDLRHGTHGSGDPAARLTRERGQRRLAAAAEDKVVRRRPQRCTDDRLPVLDEPQLLLGIDRWTVPERAGEAEDQVVPRFVREDRRGALEKVRCVDDLDDPHALSLRCIDNA